MKSSKLADDKGCINHVRESNQCKNCTALSRKAKMGWGWGQKTRQLKGASCSSKGPEFGHQHQQSSSPIAPGNVSNDLCSPFACTHINTGTQIKYLKCLKKIK